MSREIWVRSCIPSSLKVSNVMETFGAGSRKVSIGGLVAEDPHCFQFTADSKLTEFLGNEGLPVLAKLTEKDIKTSIWGSYV